MSRDGWSKKRANAGDDNGWAQSVSIHLIAIYTNSYTSFTEGKLDTDLNSVILSTVYAVVFKSRVADAISTA